MSLIPDQLAAFYLKIRLAYTLPGGNAPKAPYVQNLEFRQCEPLQHTRVDKLRNSAGKCLRRHSHVCGEIVDG